MTTLSLARRYRPRKLSELIGQPALVQTMANAIRTGRIAHAYLFSGIRGTGKTSTARIIARSLNCEQGPTPEPCGACAQCKAIIEERHLDVIEMDAASHTGVEDVRALIEGVPYAPTQGRWKVYILDEAHMLSKNAWNALLKTLEEPPAHIVFVFCTTEPRKVPATVLSRCHRFQLAHISEEELASHLAKVAAAEGAAFDEATLAIVARAAEGSVRDSLSVLDQLISTFPKGAAEAETRAMLGLPDAGRIVDIVELALGRKAASALNAWRDMIRQGADPLQGIQDIMERIHALSVLAVAPEAAKACGIDAKAAGKWPFERLQAAWTILAKTEADMAQTSNRTEAGDMAILRIAA